MEKEDELGIIAVYSPKGGVGKTTISVDLAWRFATMGDKRTLLLDLDTQGGSGFMLDVGEHAFANDPALLAKPAKIREMVALTRFDNLFFLGLDSNIRDLSFNLLQLGPKKRIRDLALKLHHTFDRIVLDCPPVRNEVSDQIVAVADLMIVPLPASPLAARALNQVRKDLAERSLRKLPVLPVFSMYDSRRKSHREAREGWMEQFPVIPSASQIEQAAFRRAPVGTFARTSGPSEALQKLFAGIEKKLGEVGDTRG